MKLFPDPKIFISIGPFNITWYALFILMGILFAYELSQRTVKKWRYPAEVLDDYVIPMMSLAIIGARIYYVIFEWSYYSKHPDQIFAIWNGGLAVHGGLIAGVLFSIWYFKTKKVDFFRFADAIVPNVLLGQACGRWGNFMNQEAYGRVVSESFYKYFPSFIKERMFIDQAYREPTFLYESVSNIIGFLFITFIFRKKLYKKRGDCLFMYGLWYGTTRFFIEGCRTDSLMLGPLRIAQVVSLGLVAFGVLGLLGVFHKLFKIHKDPVILFDLDGTLIDSRELVFETFRQVFKEKKPEYQLSEEELYSFFGPPLETSFGRYFPEDEVDLVIDCYQRINLKLHPTMLKTIPGALEAVKELKAQGYKMAVVSNKRHNVVLRGLKQADLDSYFELVLGKEDLPVPKPDPSGLIEACIQMGVGHDDVIYIGDNPEDIQAAKNMAAYSIGFTNDDTQREKLAKENPCAVIEDLKELSSICAENRPWCDIKIW